MAPQKPSFLQRHIGALALFGAIGSVTVGGSFAAVAVLDARLAPKKTLWDHVELACDGISPQEIYEAEESSGRPLSAAERRARGIPRHQQMDNVTLWEETNRDGTVSISLQKPPGQKKPLPSTCKIVRQWDSMWTKKR